MLAYVFWHWPSGNVEPRDYEQLLRQFHAALADAAPLGFRGSCVFRVTGSAPWLGSAPAYADWYLVDGSAALDPLNVAAVSGACQQPHDQAARAADKGVGSLLALHGEQADIASARVSTWLAKPKGMPYDEFYAATQAVLDPNQASLWRRQMVLGPTPEFGILSAEPVPIQDVFQPHQLHLGRL
jgi:hypothetical protein